MFFNRMKFLSWVYCGGGSTPGVTCLKLLKNCTFMLLFQKFSRSSSLMVLIIVDGSFVTFCITLNASLLGGFPTLRSWSVKSDATPATLAIAYPIVFEKADSHPGNMPKSRLRSPKMKIHGRNVARAAVPTFDGLLHICFAKYTFKPNWLARTRIK